MIKRTLQIQMGMLGLGLMLIVIGGGTLDVAGIGWTIFAGTIFMLAWNTLGGILPRRRRRKK